MRSYNFTLSSTQEPLRRKILDHYLFLDPVYGSNFTYPSTAWGSYFDCNSESCTYSVTAYGGLIYPWGYRIQTFYTNLSAGPLKGPYTITFSPSAIDTRVFSITKIIYDFGDGSEAVSIEKDLVPNNLGTFQWDGNPASINISHTYYPLNNFSTTYYPSVTVINGDL